MTNNELSKLVDYLYNKIKDKLNKNQKKTLSQEVLYSTIWNKVKKTNWKNAYAISLPENPLRFGVKEHINLDSKTSFGTAKTIAKRIQRENTL